MSIGLCPLVLHAYQNTGPATRSRFGPMESESFHGTTRHLLGAKHALLRVKEVNKTPHAKHERT